LIYSILEHDDPYDLNINFEKFALNAFNYPKKKVIFGPLNSLWSGYANP